MMSLLKQANEFGLIVGGQSIAALLVNLPDIHALGLASAKGLIFATAFIGTPNTRRVNGASASWLALLAKHQAACKPPSMVLSNVDDDCMASNVEPFAPLAATAPFSTMDDAVRFANRLPFGLASYVMTHNMRNVSAVTELIQSGDAIVNHWQASLSETPFGGYKDSGIGSEGGIEGLYEFQTHQIYQPVRSVIPRRNNCQHETGER